MFPIHGEIKDILRASREPMAEEFAIHDTENFGSYSVSEYESIESIAAIAELLIEYGEAASHILDYVGGTEHFDLAKAKLEDDYLGEHPALPDWAEEHLEETGLLDALPETLRGYFDVERFARDCELSGDVVSFELSSGNVAVFWG